MVYIATDDPGLWAREIRNFEDKGFNFIGDADIGMLMEVYAFLYQIALILAQTAGIGTRYSIDSLRNIILDVILLSESDHLVCTFSSQVCRLAYELMQTRKTDDNVRNY